MTTLIEKPIRFLFSSYIDIAESSVDNDALLVSLTPVEAEDAPIGVLQLNETSARLLHQRLGFLMDEIGWNGGYELPSPPREAITTTEVLPNGSIKQQWLESMNKRKNDEND